MTINFPKELREVFDVRNDVRARAVTEALQAIVERTPQSASTLVPGQLTPAAKRLNIVTVTTTSRVMGIEDVLLVDDDTAGGDVTITLPPVANSQYPRWIKKLGKKGKVILNPQGSATIDGAASVSIVKQDECLLLMSDETNWKIL